MDFCVIMVTGQPCAIFVQLAFIVGVRHARYIGHGVLLRLPLRNHFPCVELHQHRPISLQFLDRYGESKIVQKEKLQLQVIQLW